mgnify:CR=1 FL=1
MNLDLLLEAERRGILPADKAQLLAEARRRGLVPGDAPQAAPEKGVGQRVKQFYHGANDQTAQNTGEKFGTLLYTAGEGLAPGVLVYTR